MARGAIGLTCTADLPFLDRANEAWKEVKLIIAAIAANENPESASEEMCLIMVRYERPDP